MSATSDFYQSYNDYNDELNSYREGLDRLKGLAKADNIANQIGNTFEELGVLTAGHSIAGSLQGKVSRSARSLVQNAKDRVSRAFSDARTAIEERFNLPAGTQQESDIYETADRLQMDPIPEIEEAASEAPAVENTVQDIAQIPRVGQARTFLNDGESFQRQFTLRNVRDVNNDFGITGLDEFDNVRLAENYAFRVRPTEIVWNTPAQAPTPAAAEGLADARAGELADTAQSALEGASSAATNVADAAAEGAAGLASTLEGAAESALAIGAEAAPETEGIGAVGGIIVGGLLAGAGLLISAFDHHKPARPRVPIIAAPSFQSGLASN